MASDQNAEGKINGAGWGRRTFLILDDTVDDGARRILGWRRQRLGRW
jgi:hypothetical protein